jgi:hypothetical protein
MKSIAPVAAAVLLAASSSAFAIPLATVGGVDSLIDQADLGSSGDASELAFIADSLHVDSSTLSYTHLGDESAGANWLTVDGSSSLYAFSFNTLTPAYFLIKVGSGVGVAGDGSSETFSHYLYQNVSSLNYGVIDLSAFDRTRNRTVNIGLVSHLSTASGTPPTTSVPEPATLSLFGLAIAGIGFARRRKQAA